MAWAITRVLLLLFAVQVLADIEMEGPLDEDFPLEEYKDEKYKDPKVPKVIRRRYEAWLTAPRNTSKLYHGIPLEVTQLDDGRQLLTSPFRRTNGTILKAHLWMEFPKITSRPRFNRYFIDVTPVIGLRDATNRSDCSSRTYSTKPRFPEGELEMRFDMTALYKNCKRVARSKYFKFKLRLHAQSKDSDIDLKKEQVDMFLILKEVDHDSILLGSGIEEKNQKIVKYPQTRRFRPPRKGYTRCSLQKWEVKFKEIGWDKWIVVPPSYEPNICSGVCTHPFPDHMNATNYAILRSIVQAMMVRPRNPCCVANDLDPLTVIIMDEGNFILKVFKDMKVKNCACL